jgi:hypothetical protein
MYIFSIIFWFWLINIWMVGIALLVCHKPIMHRQWIISDWTPTPTSFVSCDAMLSPNWSCYPDIKHPSRSSSPTWRYLPNNNSWWKHEMNCWFLLELWNISLFFVNNLGH